MIGVNIGETHAEYHHILSRSGERRVHNLSLVRERCTYGLKALDRDRD